MNDIIEYTVYEDVYNEIISGNKTIEIRLLNEKSKRIKPENIIMFKNINNNKNIIVKVIRVYIYEDIDKLWENKSVLLKSGIASTKEEFTNQLYKIFVKNNVVNSKLIGICKRKF